MRPGAGRADTEFVPLEARCGRAATSQPGAMSRPLGLARAQSIEGGPVLRRIPDLPDSVIGIEAIGDVEASDYQTVLDPAVETARRTHDKLRLLYVLGDEFDDYSGGAMWEDAKLGVKNWTSWEKIAVVTDEHSLARGIKAFGWLVPGEIKIFATDQRDDATKWVSD